jgi:low temperature requirement protein LtrA
MESSLFGALSDYGLIIFVLFVAAIIMHIVYDPSLKRRNKHKAEEEKRKQMIQQLRKIHRVTRPQRKPR